MTPERWHKIRELFKSALERAPDERAAFLDQACAGDDELRKEVASLIASHEKTGSFIDAPALGAAAHLLAEKNPELTAGQRIGHYKILSLLGAGGMGEVYLAQDTRLGRKLALKMLPASFTADQKQVRRFEQEAHAASALNHPNILTVHDIGQINRIHFIATEYIEGETLRQHLAGKQISLGEAIDVAIQVSGALEAAHQAGIVHRDIKPENIMLRPDGYVKVLDFGLAKLSEGQQVRRDAESGAAAAVKTESGVVMGTAHYMSPEQARAQAVDARTDIFSLGVVIYETVTGHVPFEGETPSHVIVAILEKEPPPLVHYLPAVPAELQRIISKALCKNRDERYQTINDLMVDLKSFRKATEDGASIETALEPASRAWEQAGRVTSSADSLISGIKRHQKALALTVAMLVTVLAASAYFHFARGQKPIDSLAALPFVNVGADPNTDYLSDGITESLINSLSRLPDLKVISFSSVSRYRGQQIDPQAVARDLGVRALLVGKVTLRGDDLVVSAELVDTRDNSHIWGDQYTRKLSGILALQREISRGVSDKLRQQLSGEQKERLAKRHTESTEAYQLYLKGRHHWNKWTPDGLRKSIEHFQQAIEIDPSYALAYVGVSNAYYPLGLFDVMLPREAFPKAEAAAMKALEIDDTLGEAHAALGTVKFLYDWDWVAAEREIKRAIELNPNDEAAHTLYAYYLHSRGRADEGLAEMKRAYELNPLELRINLGLGHMLAFAHAHRQYDQAIEQFRKMIELQPGQWNLEGVYWNLGAVYEKKGMYVEAIAEYQKSLKLAGDGDLATALEQNYKTSGFREAMTVVLKTRLQNMREAAKRGRVPPLPFALIYAEVGDKDQAFEWLEKAYEERSSALTQLGTGIVCTCDALRSDPRFADLLRRIGLPPP